MNKSSNRLAAIVREPVTVAIVIAVLVTAGLVFVVLAIWSGGPDANNQLAAPALERAEITPTPRAVLWPRATPPSTTPPSTERPASPAAAQVPQINAVAAAVTPTAAASAPPPTRIPIVIPTRTPAPATRPAPTTIPTATPAPAAEPAFEATNAGSFGQMVGGRWYVSGNRFVFDSPQATSEPWILVPYQAPGEDFAIEAEVRVDGLGQGYCNQSFGLVAGSQQAGRFLGGGILYGCGGDAPLARITDVSTWTDGYDRDRALASEEFDPNDEWHLLRLEVRGTELRLLIDGAEVLTATDDQAAGGLSDGQGGLWTQGVQLTVRRFAIYEL